MKHVSRLLILLVSIILTAMPAEALAPTQKGKTSKTQTASSKAKTTQKGKGTTKKTQSAPASTKKNQGTAAKKKGASTSKKSSAKPAKPETSADLRRRQEDAQKEIKLTRQQIEENDAAVRKNLNELNRLGADIDAGKKKVAEASARVKTLSDQIATLSGQIAENESSLEKLRGEYLKAIKKIRAKRKTNSELAFIFSSGNFNQALRRMRYLRQFADWRDRQSAEIGQRVEQLKTQTKQLEASRTAQSKAMATQVKAQQELQTQYTRQDALVADLKKNGQALQAHLANKQQEANTLKQRVAALIAEEQRKAEEAARKAEEERLAAERRAREESERLARLEEEKAEAARQAAAQQKKEGDALIAKNEAKPAKNEEKLAKEVPTVASSKKKDKKTHKTEKAKEKTQTPTTGYADARKRKPRGSSAATTASTASNASSSKGNATKATSTASVASAGGKSFESMRGSLPHPVSGHFRITGRFGRHSLPDLPDVVYDNPGIDAETAVGASAQAVYGGKVSGVYMIPGFSTVVIVNHGNYYTVYGNIAAASVKVGDVVKQGQALGQVAQAEDDPSHGSIHFEVWKNRDKLDPAGWIK